MCLLGVVAVAVGVIVAWQALLDPLSIIENAVMLARIRAELPDAEALWRAQGISHYEVDIQGGSFVCRVSGRLSVRDGELVAVAMRQDPSDPSSALVEVDSSRWSSPGCMYEEMTVAGVFERVGQILDQISVGDESLHVTFDDELGYVTVYSYGAGYRRGLLNPVVSDAWIWFSFGNLRPIIGS